jgi:3-hydroxyisobutyrate dehydrogenase
MQMGLIGTGLMGGPLGDRLLQAGHSLTVYNRTVEKTAGLVQNGAVCAETPGQVIAQSETIVLMLADGAAIESCLFSETVDWAGRTVIPRGPLPGGSGAGQYSRGAIGQLDHHGGR